MDWTELRYGAATAALEAPGKDLGFLLPDSPMDGLGDFPLGKSSAKRSAKPTAAHQRRGGHRKCASDTFAFAAGAVLDAIPPDVMHLLNHDPGDLLDEELAKLPPDAFNGLDFGDLEGLPEEGDDSGSGFGGGSAGSGGSFDAAAPPHQPAPRHSAARARPKRRESSVGKAAGSSGMASSQAAAAFQVRPACCAGVPYTASVPSYRWIPRVDCG